MTSQNMDELRRRSVWQEYQFKSQTPVVGPLIAWFRSAWHGVAGKWAIRFIAQQQSTFNLELITELSDANESMAMNDQDLVRLTRSVAELTQQVIQLQRAVADLQAHQAGLRVETSD